MKKLLSKILKFIKKFWYLIIGIAGGIGYVIIKSIPQKTQKQPDFIEKPDHTEDAVKLADEEQKKESKYLNNYKKAKEQMKEKYQEDVMEFFKKRYGKDDKEDK